MNPLTLSLLLATVVGTSLTAVAETLPARAFTDHMVLQQGQPLPVFGTDHAGQAVKVSFAGQTQSTSTDKDGRWRVEFAPLPASTVAREMIIQGSSSVTLTDILVGEVWLAAGQSNMDWKVRQCSNTPHPDNFPLIRMANWTGTVGAGASDTYEAEDLDQLSPDTFYQGSWTTLDASPVADQSAVAYFFANALARELRGRGPESTDIPIGIIDISYGGTTTEAFIKPEVLQANPYLAAAFTNPREARTLGQWATSRIRRNLGSYTHRDPALPHPHPFAPGFLHASAMPHLQPLRIRGVIWYQGESNAEFSSDGFMWNGQRLADYQHQVMATLVNSWRDEFHHPDLPFYMVELPRISAPNRILWPWYRNAQQRTADEIDHVELAVVTEFGSAGSNVHPGNKEPVGERLARIALAELYRERVAHRSPVFVEHKTTKGKIHLRFDHSGGGLVDRDGGELRNFEIAGANGKFVPATATIAGTSVTVSSPDVPEPVAVRHAWTMDADVDLASKEGLTARSFRTDAWLTAPGRRIRVACIGDSITYGAGLADPATEAYPARLAGILGEAHEVRGFGKSGFGIHRPEKKYDRTREYLDALSYAPDIVICNLGINDITQWGTYQKEDMIREYRKLIDAFASLPTRPYIIQWSPLAPLFPGQRFHADPNVDTLNEWLSAAVAHTGVDTIDMFTPLKDHPKWFPDHIHPNAEGSEAIARAVALKLKQLDDVPADP
ncbi:GDSL-type esterase/lipase family protein [Haloferula rosea]|uniref:Uncharacterized protein n=1 Tax=Haloferula rosea TaxID=490093 RepID=A0A934RBV7_9BACT|nr:GDSL-type esterase/lipase family protein [Haloferula rosea]MBK1826903.1 hypothetical protein [Haloferula rosea]